MTGQEVKEGATKFFSSSHGPNWLMLVAGIACWGFGIMYPAESDSIIRKALEYFGTAFLGGAGYNATRIGAKQALQENTQKIVQATNEKADEVATSAAVTAAETAASVASDKAKEVVTVAFDGRVEALQRAMIETNTSMATVFRKVDDVVGSVKTLSDGRKSDMDELKAQLLALAQHGADGNARQDSHEQRIGGLELAMGNVTSTMTVMGNELHRVNESVGAIAGVLKVAGAIDIVEQKIVPKE